MLQQAAAQAGGCDGPAGVSAARVRKLARKALRAAPGARLKARKLLRAVAAAGAAGLTLDALLGAVRGCTKLEVSGKYVALAAAAQAA